MNLRPVWIVAAAVLLPLVVFGGVLTAFNAAEDRREVEAATLSRARHVMSQVDADLARSIAAFDVLTTVGGLRRGDWEAARGRAQEVRSLHPSWRSVQLIDARDGRTLFAVGDEGPPLSLAETAFASSSRDVVDGIRRRPGRCTCALFGRTVDTSAGPVRLIVELDVAPFQSILLKDTPPGAVAAIVDRDGRFIARSIAYAERIGLPATSFVRDALTRGAEGVYEGETYEGLVNYTAFVMSPETGWSTHIAVSSSLVEAPQRLWWAGMSLAAGAALAFAAALLWLGARAYGNQRAIEERLRASERMEALGKLTGGVAHDFNNMLAIVVGSLDLAQRRLGEADPRVGRQLEIAMEGAQRAAELVQRMLAFARRQALAPEVLHPAAVLEDIRELLRSTIGEDIRLECRVTPGTRSIRVDRLQLENALVNLAANARDAMPDGGRLTIVAGNTVGRAKSTGAPGGAMVAFEVMDTGEGMAPEVRARALEPFFTTKEAGRGTGLGLSQIYGFVRQSGGDLRIESAPGSGTRVAMLFPATDDAPSTAVFPDSAERPRASLRAQIVLVEDDAGVRETVRTALEELGHEVRVAPDARAALALLDDVTADLVLSDVVMPGMSGVALARELARRRPAVRVLLMSAFTRDADLQADDQVRLRKPFTIAELDAAVAKALESRDPPAQP